MKSSRLLLMILLFWAAAIAQLAHAQEPPLVVDDYPRYGLAMPPNFRVILQPLVTQTLATIGSGGTARIRIYGHADFDAQGHDFEMKISVERAIAAQQTFMSGLMAQAELAGIPRDKLLGALDLSIQGMGTSHPVVPNPRSDADRRKNRRVEYVAEFIPKKGRTRPPPPPPLCDPLLRLVGAGVWTGSTSVTLRGEQIMKFVVENKNLLGATITITNTVGGEKHSKIILPTRTEVLEFSNFKEGPMTWTFDVDTNSDAFVVSWQAFSFMPPAQCP